MLFAPVLLLGVRMKRLILLAHGSRDPLWRQPFEALSQRIALSQGASSVALAYMEMAEPTLLTVAAEAVAAGATQLLVLPLFMAAGGHLRHDVPLLMDQIRHNHPAVLVHMLPPIGEHPQVQAAIENIAHAALESD
ncbi:MAG: CbiX/SirB N-terminal domain-containing protein [Vampirovibrionales bacterium]|nr:CbiX/SirB N-terminal domain-containing protein [Vampirovibrionales bacterium]